ncbi:MAG TPA: OB-fold nucleic acid binding domain-containing protein, partial [Chitinophaga sp.]|nr:OB-fold nucleic acid binding domain-containing protein [Chitinophaga sp.]
FKQLEGFGAYGFPESHAASFALLVYVSSWLKCFYPDVFATALLNSMPMGFYQPAQIIIDARKHGVEVRPVDVNHSEWDNILEPTGERHAIRLGFRQVKGLQELNASLILSGRGNGYSSIPALAEAGVPVPVLERLAEADAFRSLGFDRRTALWEVNALADRPIALFTGQPSDSIFEEKPPLPVMTDGEHVLMDYASTALSIKAHPVSFAREKLRLLNVVTAAELASLQDGITVQVAGLVLVRQQPGTAKGICFITLEDETGSINLVAFQNIFSKYRREILSARLLMAEGKLQIEGKVIHVIITRCYNINPMLRELSRLRSSGKENQQEKLFPDARNFK